MSKFDTFLTVLKATASPMDSNSLIVGTVVFLAAFTLLGLGWGRLWNRSFLGGWPGFVVSGLFALFLGLLAFVFSGAEAVVERVQLARSEAPEKLPKAPAIERKILSETWAGIQPLGGQSDLTSPDLGGTEVNITSEEALRILAQKSAEVARRELPNLFPILNVMGFEGKSPEQIAFDVISEEETQQLPADPITMNNDWTRAAIAGQADTIFESALKRGTSMATSVRELCKYSLIAVIVSQLVVIPLLALGNIKTKF